MLSFMKKIYIFLCVLLFSAPSFAAEPSFKYGSLRKSEANVRCGPGTQYPILWVYKRFGWPVEVLAEYQSWYKIRDIEGEEGWVYRSLLSSQRTVIVSDGKPLTLFKKQDKKLALLRFSPGVILTLHSCAHYQCEVTYKKNTGWVMKNRLLMLNDMETM